MYICFFISGFINGLRNIIYDFVSVFFKGLRDFNWDQKKKKKDVLQTCPSDHKYASFLCVCIYKKIKRVLLVNSLD